MNKHLVRASVFAGLLAASGSVSGATKVWDGSAGTTWDTGATASWTGLTWTAADDASFAGAGVGAVNVIAGGVAATTINFGAGGYALAGGTINLASADGNGGGTDVVVTGSNSIANNIVMTGGTSGILGLSIGGAGTLAYSGVVTPYNGRMDLKDTVTLDLLTGSSISLTGSNGNQILFANTGSSLVLNGGSFSATGNNGANASFLYNLTMNSGTASMGGALSSQVSLLAGGTVSLNGGTWSVQGVSGAATNTMNFNGGTLRALASHAAFLPTVLVTKVQAGGAKVDTNGFNPVIGAVLAHDAALGATLDGGLVKSGTGTLILTAANTYTGGTTINAGTLQVGNGGATGSLGTGAVVDNAALVYNQTSITVGNAISGTGTVSGATAGTLTISQGIALTDNNFTFTSAGGSLAAGVGLSVGTGAGSITSVSAGSAQFTVAAGAHNLSASGGGSVGISGQVATGGGGFAGLVLSGSALTTAGTVNLSGRNTGEWGVNYGSSASITATSGTTTLTGNTTNNSAGKSSFLFISNPTITLTANPGAAIVFQGGAAGGTGNSIFNDYNSATVFNTSGDVTFRSASASATTAFWGAQGTVGAGAPTFNVAAGGVLTLDAGVSLMTTGLKVVSSGASVTVAGSGTGTMSGAMAVNAGTLTYNLAGALTQSGAVGGAGALVKQGTGVLTLSSAGSTYAGATTILAGTLIAGNANAVTGISSGTAVLLGDTTGSSNATLQLGSSSTTTYGNNITVQSGNSGVASLNGHGTITLNGSVTLGTASSTGKGLTLANPGNAAWTFTVAGVVQDPAGMSVGTAGVVTIGSGNIGTVRFNNTNTYTGGTTISAGTLYLGATAAAGPGAITLGDAATGSSPVKLTFGAANVANPITVANLGTGTATLLGNVQFQGQSGTIALNRATILEIPANGAGTDWWYSFGGIISGSGPVIIKGGSGGATAGATGNRIMFAVGNTYTGGTVIESGKLQLGVATAAGTGTITLGNAATGSAVTQLRLGGNLANNIVVSADAPLSPAGIGGYIATPILTGSLQVDRALEINGASDRLTWSGAGAVWSGAGNITINGGRVTHDTAVNTWTGNLTVNASSIFQPGGAASLTSANSVTANGTFQLNNVSQAINGLSGSGTVQNVIGANTLTVGGGNAGGTFSGIIQNGAGVLTLIKAGGGTQILSGANAYTGPTTINGGVLQIGNGGMTGTLGTGAVTDNASLVFTRSNDLAVAHNIGGTGTLTQAGPGTLTLNGANSYAGTTFVNQGALILNGTIATGGLIAVSAGASFGGGGAGGSATFAGAGDFSPGAADMSDNQLDLAGLTLSGSTVLKYELGTPSSVADFWYDHVALSGPLTLAGSLRVTAVDNINTSFGTPVAGDRWLLMAYPTGGGMLTNNGLTVDTANSPALSSGLVYQIDTSTDGAVYLTVAVPEAGTGALIALGLALLARSSGLSPWRAALRRCRGGLKVRPPIRPA